jgi:probable F420-dependent oxidoreductase
MKIGFVIRNSGLDAIKSLKDMPAIAEDLGFDSIWLTDHVIGARAYTPVYEPEWAEIVTGLAYLAARTSTVKLGTGVLVLPYRDPVLTAKMIATIDNLSGGRVILGVGAGWSKTEYAALGRFDRFDARGAVTDETIEVMRRCWEGGEFDWDGTAFKFRNVTFGPVPVQARLPIWVGGQSPPALRRTAAYGDAWHPTGISAAEMADLGAKLDERAGRPIPRTLRVSMSEEEVDAASDFLAPYEEAGCLEVAIAFRQEPYTYDVQLELMRKLAARLIGAG